MKIIIEEYNPKWVTDFEIEQTALLKEFKVHPLSIEHIGSTSIKNLCAKPIIDMMIGIDDFNKTENFISPLVNQGYKYVPEFEKVMPYRKFFYKELDRKRTHHIHLVEINSEFWKRHIQFRNHLRNNKEDREAYQTLKEKLSKEEWNDRNEYTKAKSSFIQSIESKFRQ